MIWNLFTELRKELLEAQKIRAQVMGFKISFVTAMLTIISANIKNIDLSLFVIPALASIFFDYIIYSYSFSIKRIGGYVRDHIEPALKEVNSDLPEDFVMWQQYLMQPKTKQFLSFYGNLGITTLMTSIAITAQLFPFRPLYSSLVIIILSVALLFDVKACLEPRKLGKIWHAKDFELKNKVIETKEKELANRQKVNL